MSWHLKHPPIAGDIELTSSLSPMHYANFSFKENVGEIIDFNVIEPEKMEDIIPEWSVSDKFEETLLDDLSKIQTIIDNRTWKETVKIEENSVANLSYAATRYGSKGNTVFAKVVIQSDKDQVKLFHFGYSDRVVTILNGTPIYKGTNRFRSRDYRYLGTVGLFDAIYLDLKKGENTLMFAVSEDFGGWGITGKFDTPEGIGIQ